MKPVLKFATIVFTLLVWTGWAHGQTTRPAEKPIAAIDHVVLISIDGCRPDLLLRADTPVIHGLLPKASFSFWARTTAESITLPSHTSMVTGVVPIKHGIQWNADLPLQHPIYPNYPTLFQLGKKVGYTTAMAAGKGKFKTLAVPGSLDWEWVPATEKTEDNDVTENALKIIHDHKPDIMFVHLPSDDNVGHAVGWGSRQQLDTLANADKCIGKIMQAYTDEKLDGSTCFIITADHGGFGRVHGPDDVRCRYIPWICTGPGIKQNFDLTTDGNLTIDTEDSFSTICYLMGIPVEKKVDGKPIKEIVDRKELLGAP